MKYVTVFVLFLSFTAPVLANQDQLFDQEDAIAASFSRFMDSFITILTQKAAQKEKARHTLIYSVIEINQLLNTTKKSPSFSVQTNNSFRAIDQQLIDQLSYQTATIARTITILRNKQKNAAIDAKHKADVQKILNCFTGVMQSFFSIVQEPENKQNVAQGIIGMLGNIIAAGNVIIKDSPQNSPPPASIEQVVDAMDQNTKQLILNLIESQGQCIRVQTEH